MTEQDSPGKLFLFVSHINQVSVSQIGLAKRFIPQTNEFEQMHVTEDQIKGGKSFFGMILGEQTTGTEFVIGSFFFRSSLFNCSLNF